jgi:DNA-binding LacI/PurR family transcriptional regulator
MVNIGDVAAHAGVSRSTVSYVLTGKRRITPLTEARVRRSIAALGYRPDPRARALALNRTNIIGLLASVDPSVTDADIDIFMRFVRAAMYCARPHGYDVLIMGKGEEELQGDVLADALLVMDVRWHDPRLPVLAELDVPVVLIGAPDDRGGLSAIDLDFEHAGRLAAGHLADLGHQQIAVLGPRSFAETDAYSYAVRLCRGFLAECERRQITGSCLGAGDGETAVASWLERMRSELPHLSGIVVHGASPAHSLLDALAARGAQVPRDCSVIAIAPQTLRSADPRPLTTIDLPETTMVDGAVQRLVTELNGAGRGHLQLLPAVMHDRGTTGPYGHGTVHEPGRRTGPISR